MKVLQKCNECGSDQKSNKFENCGLCDIQFNCKNCKLIHILKEHLKGWHCVKYEYKSLVRRNPRTHFQSDVKNYLCETCAGQFRNNFELKRHQQRHRHGTFSTQPERKIQCGTCMG